MTATYFWLIQSCIRPSRVRAALPRHFRAHNVRTGLCGEACEACEARAYPLARASPARSPCKKVMSPPRSLCESSRQETQPTPSLCKGVEGFPLQSGQSRRVPILRLYQDRQEHPWSSDIRDFHPLQMAILVVMELVTSKPHIRLMIIAYAPRHHDAK